MCPEELPVQTQADTSQQTKWKESRALITNVAVIFYWVSPTSLPTALPTRSINKYDSGLEMNVIKKYKHTEKGGGYLPLVLEP